MTFDREIKLQNADEIFFEGQDLLRKKNFSLELVEIFLWRISANIISLEATTHMVSGSENIAFSHKIQHLRDLESNIKNLVAEIVKNNPKI